MARYGNINGLRTVSIGHTNGYAVKGIYDHPRHLQLVQKSVCIATLQQLMLCVVHLYNSCFFSTPSSKFSSKLWFIEYNRKHDTSVIFPYTTLRLYYYLYNVNGFVFFWGKKMQCFWEKWCNIFEMNKKCSIWGNFLSLHYHLWFV